MHKINVAKGPEITVLLLIPTAWTMKTASQSVFPVTYRGLWRNAIKQLLAAALIERIGKGVSRDPHLYFTQLANGGE